MNIDNLKNLTVRDPDALLMGINRSIMGKAFLVSAVGHLLVFIFTSFSLYRDWVHYGVWHEEYGFVTPADIRSLQKAAMEAEAEARRKEEADARRQEQMAEAEPSEGKEATPSAKAPEAVDAADSGAGTDTTNPLEEEVLPRLKPASLDDASVDLDL